MLDWLQSSVPTELDIPADQIAFRLLLSTVAGLLVAVIAHFAHGYRKADSQMLSTTLVLLTLLITMVTLVIGNSVARAFGLVGALSIVRFRTVVDDTRDTAFVIFSVIVGMAIGAGTFLVPAVGVPLVAVVAISLGRMNKSQPLLNPSHQLIIRLGLGRDPQTAFGEILDRHVPLRMLTATTTARQGTSIELTYSVTIPFASTEATLPKLVAELNQTDGVQGVELTRRS